MINNYNSSNTDKGINNNDNDNNITSIILEIKVFFTSYLKVFKLMFLFIYLGNLFQTNKSSSELRCILLSLKQA